MQQINIIIIIIIILNSWRDFEYHFLFLFCVFFLSFCNFFPSHRILMEINAMRKYDGTWSLRCSLAHTAKKRDTRVTLTRGNEVSKIHLIVTVTIVIIRIEASQCNSYSSLITTLHPSSRFLSLSLSFFFPLAFLRGLYIFQLSLYLSFLNSFL